MTAVPTPARATWRLTELELALGEPEESLRARAAERLGLAPDEIAGFRIARKALDARRRGGGQRLRFVCSVDVVVDARKEPPALRRALRAGRVASAPEPGRVVLDTRHTGFDRPGTPPAVVVGAGPAGLFAAFVLAHNGVPVVLIERGPPVDRRGRALARFHRTREVNSEANLLFGEGGAGTYSDGKIYTRIDDPLEVPLLEELVECGAPPEIVYDSLAHIGTDRLHRLLPRLRERMQALGVRFVFDTRFEGLVTAASGPEQCVRAVRTSQGEVACSGLVIAVGHSARDTWRMLRAAGLAFEARPFQLGVRIEHPQELIDAGRLGDAPEARLLGAAGYNLVSRASDGVAAAHSFCMCPGGRIVASVNEAGLICTNGMSNSRHSSRFATAAIVTTLAPGPGDDPFRGVALQRELEQRFFAAGGADYGAPAQRADDFLAGRTSSDLPATSWRFGTVPARIDALLPRDVHASLARALLQFERAIPGFAGPAGLFVGIESRSSSPVRMLRDRATRRASAFTNLYPVGEGAGWAGGIMSAALDGANAAQSLLRAGPGNC